MKKRTICLGPCWVHKGTFPFDPDRVTSVLIDPQRGFPPDVDAGGHRQAPGPGAVARSVRQPICPQCCKRLNAELARRGEPASFDETDTGQVRQ